MLDNISLIGDGTSYSHCPSFVSDTASPPEMSYSEYEIWKEFILKRNGHFFSENRRRFLSQRLWERMRILGMKSYYDFYNYIAFNQNGENEWLILQELLLNHETSFFRHKPSFNALATYVLPRLRNEKQEQDNRIITMWSAGCSTGQESYSMAMTFFEALATSPQPLSEGGWGGGILKISGSDICLQALKKARRGNYKAHELRYLPDHYRRHYMKEIKDGKKHLYQIIDKIRDTVKHGYLHLHKPQSYWISGQDIIFCQNVLIYFEQENRFEIVNRLCRKLNLGGYLFLGPAEIIGSKLPDMKLIRLKDVLIYKRTQ